MSIRAAGRKTQDTQGNPYEQMTDDVTTIYIGGGTPSQLSPENFEKILTHVADTFECSLQETTVEMNPDDISFELVDGLKQLGVDRVSMGAQTFSDKRLGFLRRRHKSQQVDRAVDIIQAAGITNVSIDLMFGFPEQTMEEWDNDIRHALGLGVKHISAYSLMYEEGTPLYRMLQQGRIRELDEDTCADMYYRLIDMTEKAGFEHYEISNFARDGFRSRHNSSYWQDIPYMGIGAAAHSYDRKTRRWNVADIEQYITSIENGLLPCTVENIDNDTHYNDMVTTALRTSDGIELDSLLPQYKSFILEQSSKLVDNGLLEIKGDRLRLTRRALFVSDMVMSELIKV